MSRPQPRRSTCLSHSHFPSDAVPRVPAHPPPTLHPLSSDGVTAARENDSFTFHASSCSEAELPGDVRATHSQGLSTQQAVESAKCTLMCHGKQSLTAAHPTSHSNTRTREFYSPHNEPPLPNITFERSRQTGTQQEYVCSHGEYGKVRAGDGQGQGARTSSSTADLSSHSVLMEIVQMRDELKRFHDLKLHHKQLEAQLVAKIKQDDSETIAKV